MSKMSDPSVGCRLVCADDQLVSASFLGAKEARLAGGRLIAHGIVEVEGDRFHEMAVVDQVNGLEIPCDWIEWRKHPDGYTYCWVAGTDPDPLHVPENWTPEHSRGVTFEYFHDEPGRCLKLAEEDGREVWLDFQTGAIESLLPHPHTPEPVEGPALPTAAMTIVRDGLFLNGEGAPDADGGKLMAIVRAVLDAYDCRYQMRTPEALAVTIRNTLATYAMFFTATDATGVVRLTCSYGSNVPEDRRIAMAEAMSRINGRIRLGNFEMDFEDGELRFRVSIDVDEGILSERMVENMWACAFHTTDRFHQALMRVAFADVEPAIAIAEVP